MNARVPEPSEIAEDLAALAATVKEGQAAILKEIAAVRREQAERDREMAETYLRKDVYEAKHKALRSEIALEFANVEREQKAHESAMGSVRTIAMWALGLVAALVLAALVGFLVELVGSGSGAA